MQALGVNKNRLTLLMLAANLNFIEKLVLNITLTYCITLTYYCIYFNFVLRRYTVYLIHRIQDED